MERFERLKSKKEIRFVFDNGNTLSCFPIRLLFIKNMQNKKSNVAFTVGKKTVSKAVDRNKIKRIMREVFRVNDEWDSVFLGHSLVFVYLAKEVVCFKSIKKGFSGVLTKFLLKN